jgi:hypothetical protein
MYLRNYSNHALVKVTMAGEKMAPATLKVGEIVIGISAFNIYVINGLLSPGEWLDVKTPA